MCLLSSCGSLLQLLWISKWILTQTCLYFDNSLSRYKTETLCLTYLVLLENFLALHTFVSLFPGSYKNNLNSLSSTKAKKIEQQHILSAVLNSSYTMESPWRCLQIHCFPPPTDKRFFFFSNLFLVELEVSIVFKLIQVYKCEAMFQGPGRTSSSFSL